MPRVSNRYDERALMPEMVSLEIDSIAAGGDGVGRSNGLVVFVPRTAPGDLVTARIAGKASFARGTLRTVTRPSPIRVDPPCPHYTRDRCGGCQIQHMSYESQLRAKKRIIRDSLERIGKRKVGEPEMRASRDEWRYRAKLTLAMRKSDGGKWIAGLHRYDDPSQIFELGDCLITDSKVVAVWRSILGQARFFPSTPALRGSVRLTADGPVFTLIGDARFPMAAELFAAVPELSALWWETEAGTRRLLHDRRPHDAAISPGASFAQVNAAVATELRAHVIELVTARAPRLVVDAYSGAGETAVELARSGARVTAIELDAEAANWCASQLPEGSVSIRGRVESALPSALPADAVILNPPRAGVGSTVTDALEQASPRPAVVVYVSCNPATLARDLSRMPGYQIKSLVAFDMFPQTAHVETVCELVPAVVQ
jgi:23S rRNA (uracil1939-C5)-methyltransferase